jgi:hypothetical protein
MAKCHCCDRARIFLRGTEPHRQLQVKNLNV